MEASQPNPVVKALSASRIKTLENCSWLYWCVYHLRLPQVQNEGAKKGQVCHSIFELLLNKKHIAHFNKMIKEDSVTASKPVERLIRRYLQKLDLDPFNTELFLQIDQMIMVGLKNDFFGKGGKIVAPEYSFEIANEVPVYLIKGFIDKPFIKNNKIIIDDFKSSKKKFEGEDKESNLQALIYSLAATKIWPDLTPVVRFIFLQYPDDPMQKVQYTPDALKGFEFYLENIQKKVNGFDEYDAKSAYAYDQGRPEGGEFKGELMCGRAKYAGHLKKDGKKMWHCPFKFGFNYYAIKKDGKIKTTIFESDRDKVQLKEDETIEFLTYQGCPRHNIPNVLDGGFDAPVEVKKNYPNALDDF